MAGGAPGTNSRGRGGKFRKFTRGGQSRISKALIAWCATDTRMYTGGKHFSRDLRPLDADGNEISMWSQDAKKQQSGSDDDDEDEDSSEEESDDDGAGPSQSAAAAELSREERKNQKKARKEAAIAKAKAASIQVGDLPPSDSDESDDDDDMPANPNHSKAARKQAIAPVKKKDDDVDEVAEGVAKVSVSKQPQSRKERESAEAALAKERYMKMHLAGKTDEAKADMARLAEIRAKREADKARREVWEPVRLLLYRPD